MASGEIDYARLLQRALRSVVREVLERTLRDGLPGEHHFYLSIRTDHPQTSVPPFLRQRYPEEITVVMQHQFWDLGVGDEGFAVTLRFDGMPARLVVPWEAVVAFFDPVAEFGLRFDLAALSGASTGPRPTPMPVGETSSEKAAAPESEQPAADPPAAAGAAAEPEGKVLSFGRPRERREDE
ncbi:MAG TPA: ClpXP protease specificity-enhancing factor SspB [Thermoanaerobaculia bacterium]|jgi:hypothetical protein|nr:ClpXP protease specificity-enhancing factor SspB [Thermoanaerobaculia bacterium]